MEVEPIEQNDTCEQWLFSGDQYKTLKVLLSEKEARFSKLLHIIGVRQPAKNDLQWDSLKILVKWKSRYLKIANLEARC